MTLDKTNNKTRRAILNNKKIILNKLNIDTSKLTNFEIHTKYHEVKQTYFENQ